MSPGKNRASALLAAILTAASFASVARPVDKEAGECRTRELRATIR